MNKRMKKKQAKNETRAVATGLCTLLLLTQKRGLNFSTQPSIGGVYVWDPETKGTVTQGYIENWPHDTPLQEISRMIKEAVEYK